MTKKTVVALLSVGLLVLVSLLVIGRGGDVSAQGMIEYGGRLVVKYEALFFDLAGWRSGVEGGCVVYESLKSPDEGASMLVVILSEDLWSDLFPTDPYHPLEFQYPKGAVLTVCGDTVHLLWYPVASGG